MELSKRFRNSFYISTVTSPIQHSILRIEAKERKNYLWVTVVKGEVDAVDVHIIMSRCEPRSLQDDGPGDCRERIKNDFDGVTHLVNNFNVEGARKQLSPRKHLKYAKGRAACGAAGDVWSGSVRREKHGGNMWRRWNVDLVENTGLDRWNFALLTLTYVHTYPPSYVIL